MEIQETHKSQNNLQKEQSWGTHTSFLIMKITTGENY